MFEEFQSHVIDVEGASIHLRVGGSGPALLLLHGYPQSHAMWHQMAPEVAKSYRVIVADLRGYGASVCHNEDFTFRAMAGDMLAVMSALGEERFDLIGHDRGARVSHRMVLDAPDRLRSVAILDILPTLDVWRLMDAELAKRYYHWGFLAQPGDMPQRLINSDPVFYLRNALGALSGQIEMFHPEALSDYEAAARRPEVVRAWCGDYHAGAYDDLDIDRADLGRQVDLPCLVLWGTRGVVDLHEDPVTLWRNWFPQAQGQGIEAGHFLVEECPDEVLPLLRAHLDAVSRV